MSKTLRGADIVARSLEQLGATKIFTLSGNHIMSIFDAALETKLELIHVRHEAATVHMADAWGRLTGEAGIAMVTGGPGHANAVGALYTALAAESPMVLLSGHAMTSELGRGGFQEIRQADMAAPVAKASWTSTSAANLGRDVAEAMRIATTGRPGPVHVSLPSDLLDENIEANAIAWPDKSSAAPAVTLADAAADAILDAVAAAKRPLLLAGPQLAHAGGRARVAKLEAATGAPAVIMESVRGLRDATLGTYAGVLKRADLVVLLGKPFDFTLHWGAESALDPACKLVVVDPEGVLVERAVKEKGASIVLWSGDRRSGRRVTVAGTPKCTWLSTAGRKDGRSSNRRRRANCIRPKCFVRFVPSRTAIPTRCSFATAASSRSGGRPCSRPSGV
jgi:acetolactate synthase-1/2/3 large subunit